MEKIDRRRIGEYIVTTLRILHDAGGSLPGREVMRQLGERIKLTPFEEQRYERTGYARWQSYVHFYSINAVKAGWLVKKKGVWYLTPEGLQACTLSPDEAHEAARKAYADWKRKQQADEHVDAVEEVDVEEVEVTRVSAYEQSVGLARQEIQEYIENLGPYEFQDLVAALLRGMGYSTPFVAPKGKDGGVDVLAYRDPLGTDAPRIKVQVKHRPSSKVTVQEVRQLGGLLSKDGDVGLIVSSGGFTPDAISQLRNSARHMEKIDLDDLINLWQSYYTRLSEEDRALLPLRTVMFLAADG